MSKTLKKSKFVAIRCVLLSSKCSKTAPDRNGGAYDTAQTGSNVHDAYDVTAALCVNEIF